MKTVVKDLIMSILLIHILWTGCAVPSPPSGGDLDKTPPTLFESESTANYQLNSEQRRVELVFDEYITVQNISSELVVSPPLRYGPKLRAAGKKAIFEFDEREELADSTTYVIQFGESIVDFREGNAFPGYKHIFSTGPILDESTITGSVSDYITDEAIGDAVVALYRNLDDTACLLYTSPSPRD